MLERSAEQFPCLQVIDDITLHAGVITDEDAMTGFEAQMIFGASTVFDRYVGPHLAAPYAQVLQVEWTLRREEKVGAREPN